MNKKHFNSKFNEAYLILSEISNLKGEIEDIKSEISTKKDLLNTVFNERMNYSITKEERIKTLMDNRHFKYMKIIDFLLESDVSEQQGFMVNEDSGFIMSEILKKPEINLFKKSINPSNKNEMIFEFDNSSYSNLISFSFKNKAGIPVTPKNVKMEYNGRIEDFFEPNFRYYNRNAKNIYVNNFYFYPKKVLRVFAEFDEEFDFNTSNVSLFSCSFNVDQNNFFDINIENKNDISVFNIFKNTDETNVPLIFEYTEDNSNYNKIEFKNQEAVISLENSSNFKLRVKKDYSNTNIKEFTEIKKQSIAQKSMAIVDNICTFETDGKIKNYDIVFTQGAYKKLRDAIGTVFGDNNKISDFISSNDKVFKVKKEYVSIINEASESINNMIYFDDLEGLKDDNSLFNFYINERTKKLYFSNFFKEYNFFLELESEIVVENIGPDLLTPYVFDIQIKG